MQDTGRNPGGTHSTDVTEPKSSLKSIQSKNVGEMGKAIFSMLLKNLAMALRKMHINKG